MLFLFAFVVIDCQAADLQLIDQVFFNGKITETLASAKSLSRAVNRMVQITRHLKKSSEPKIDQKFISFFKANRSNLKVLLIYHEHPHTKKVETFIFGDSCQDLVPFAFSFIYWAKPLSNEFHNHLPTCVCEDSVCAIELTKYVPQCFQKKVLKEMSCHGPNCYNTALISRGFLTPNQFRYSHVEELSFYLNSYCREIPVEQRALNDIVLYSEDPDIFATHAGIYISNDISFSKAGLLKTGKVYLENWGEKFSKNAKFVRVYRCNVPASSSASELYSLETEYSKIFDGETAINEKLLMLESKAIAIDKSKFSKAQEYAWYSLMQSIYLSKDKLVFLKTSTGEAIASIHSIKSVRKAKNSSGAIEIGDFVTLIPPLLLPLKAEEFYEVQGIQ